MLNWEMMSNSRKPLGKYSPWVWAVELVRGCNLKCWHCTSRVFPKDGENQYMSVETWKAMMEVIAEITPSGRLEIGQCGEPSLHPNLLEMIRSARKISPTTQLMTHTNGITLLSGKLKITDMFDAGFNAVSVDVYKRMDWYIAMAKESGAEWYSYDDRKLGSEKHGNAFTYSGDPNMKLVVLRSCPEKRIQWRNAGRLSTFLNHIDWKTAMPYGLVPVREPYQRKCTIPMRFSTVDHLGNYLFCCVDFECETAGLMGNVHDGVEGFKRYWFGRLMQTIRKNLHAADREKMPYCIRCNCAFSKCDWTGLWKEGSFDEWWDGEKWVELPPRERDNEVFVDGWKKCREVQAGLPSIKQEVECLGSSSKLIIHNNPLLRKKDNGFFSVDEIKKMGIQDVS